MNPELRRLVDEILAKYKVHAIILFGSRARGGLDAHQ